jgi:cbb3-type cytochrome oxidase maturation protein
MTALVWLIPAALALGLLGLVAFLWALKSGQFEDLEGAGWRAIQDNDAPLPDPAPNERRKPEERP